MSFISALRTRASRTRRRIAFPESYDERVLEAVRRLADDGIVEPVLILDPARGASHAAACAVGVETIHPLDDPRRERVVADLIARRGPKGLLHEAALASARDPLMFANDLVLHGDVAGTVAGCVYRTADVMRSAFWMIGPAPGLKTVSSAFYMVTSPFRGDGEEVITFTDCAVVPYPTAEQLADIAIAASHDRRRIVGDEPIVAMLSFSTNGSADGASVELVREATGLVRRRQPQLAVDGELQGDAALIASVAARKAPESACAGRANVLVFPSLDAGNIAYKLVERIARASAIGPIVQGLAMPCNDLSRGASADDIMNVAAVTSLQAAPPPP